MKRLIFFGLMFCNMHVNAQSIIPWASKRLEKMSSYAVANYLNPHSLQADFSGDGNLDVALLIERKSDGKKGMIILFGKSEQSFVVGAGTPLSSGGDDFKWAGSWSVFTDTATYETTFTPEGDVEGSKALTLKRPAIEVREDGGSGGLIYFDGKKIIWIHQGD